MRVSPRPAHRRPRVRPRLLAGAGLLAALLVASAGPALATAAATAGHHTTHHRRHRHHRRVHTRARTSAKLHAVSQPLVFGIYPGGAAGAVGPSAALMPENPSARLQALQQLRPPGRPFVLHLYAGYGGPGGASAAQEVAGEVASYTAAGFQVEVALCYRPADMHPAADVPGFVAFTRQAVDQLGANRGVVGLQVTNEANIGGAPNASDGYYPGAADALIQGVIAAKQESRAHGFGQLRIGFNWAYSRTAADETFWRYLGQHGGTAFRNAVDWVGIDAYPGTWGPPLAGGQPLAQAVQAATDEALGALRNVYMPLANLSAGVPIHFSESGYPTGPGRSYSAQANVLQALVDSVTAARASYNVTDYRWFDLRDANSSSQSFEDQYGLMTDRYQPKPAFRVYAQLVAQLG